MGKTKKSKTAGGGGKSKSRKKLKSAQKDVRIPKSTKKWKNKTESLGSATRASDNRKKNYGATTSTSTTSTKNLTLREKMLKRLNAAKFRQLNEDLDSMKNENPEEAFDSEVSVFAQYHETYKERIQQWPVDPLNLIIAWIKESVSETSVVADFGCGEARLAQSVPHKVHSFDLFALNERVTACDMSNCPLPNGTVDVAVYCLSLMGVDIGKFICEANRVLKKRGVLKIAEVASRFNNVNSFLKRMRQFGFVTTQEQSETELTLESSGNVFYLFEFRKNRNVSVDHGKTPKLKLQPCVYKKR